MAERSRNIKNNQIMPNISYEYGSAVRKLNTAEPKVRPKTRRDDQEALRKRRQEQQIRINNRMNLVYTAVIVCIASAVFFVCYQYLNMQSTVKANSERVIQLQTQLKKLKERNDVDEADTNAGIDYDSIYDTAVNELGMVYPKRSQVIGYDSAESEYVKQYKDIPPIE